jgi:FMN reductase
VTQGRLKIFVALGSARQNSNTRKATGVVMDELRQLPDVDAELIDPRLVELRLPGLDGHKELAQELTAKVRTAAGVVLVTPEYDGSYSSVIKLVIEHLGYPSSLAGKPVSILGVASGRIGAVRAVEHLRSVCTNIGALVLPRSQSIAAVHHMFDDKGHCTDQETDEAIRSLTRDLVDFARKLT